MKIYGFTKEAHGVMQIENTLEAWEKFVGGYIEAVSIAENLMLICNEDGKLINLEKRCVWVQDNKVLDIIYGNCFVCRRREDEEVSIKDSDIDTIKKILKPIVAKK